nr:MAG TPA: hypothetical protein [Caudoviricetes sp.]
MSVLSTMDKIENKKRKICVEFHKLKRRKI